MDYVETSTVVLLTAVVLVLRLFNLDNAYDIFHDEATYAILAENLLESGRIQFEGVPFYLHPPLSIVLNAGMLLLVGSSDRVVENVYLLRHVTVAFATISSIGLYVAVRQLTNRSVAVATTVVFAVDPFIIRFDSRVMIETVAMAFCIWGVVCLIVTAQGGVRSKSASIATGVAMGMAVLTKETAVFVSVLPVVVLLVSGWVLSRRVSARMLLVAVSVYAVYPALVVAHGDGPELVEQKARGVLRLLGVIQETGFNNPTAPTLASRLSANLLTFGGAYFLIVSGGIATAFLLFRRDPRDRLVAVWALCAFGLLGYAMTLGTIEEQMFYLLLLPSLVALARTSWHCLSVRRGKRRGWAERLSAAAGVLLILVSLTAWTRVHLYPDNAYEEMLGYFEDEVPRGSRVAATTDASALLLVNYERGDWDSAEELQEYAVQYAVISSSLVEQGYGNADPELVSWLQANAEEVFAFNGRGEGRLSVFRIS